ncbi:MAG: hypothetical protein QOH46_1746 [Solirubrobacteraceae bacterium]|nr:hypothetical protein [Solirubrobacteraceae bacterium]
MRVRPPIALTIAAAAVAYGLAVALVVPRVGGPPTTYADASATAAWLDLTAGLGLIGVGIALWAVHGGGSLGPLAAAAGVVWLAPNWVGWENGPGLARSLAMVIALYLPALLVHVVSSAPDGRLSGRSARLAVGAAYVATTVLTLARAAVRDPFEDPHCWSNCTDNVLLVHAERSLARGLDDAWPVLALALAAAAMLVALARLVRSSRLRRRSLWPVAVPAVALAAGEAAYAVALIADPLEDPRQDPFGAVFVGRAAAATLLVLGLGWVLRQRIRTRAIVSGLAGDLRAAPAPGTLRDALAVAIGDPSLRIGYWLETEARFVDASGAGITPPPGRTTTPVQRDGRLVAALWHDPSIAATDVEQEIGAAARLAIENERLQAERLARLEQLRALRARVIEAGDRERQRLERDLHDGAQQRLLALSFDLRLAAAEAPELATAVEEAQAILAELRELAAGIHPAILTDAGLGPALESLADTAPVPLAIEAVPAARFEAPLETAVYLLVAEQVAGRDTGAPAVRIRAREAALDVEIDDARELPTHLADRVAALGGSAELAGGTLRASIPVSSRVAARDHGAT